VIEPTIESVKALQLNLGLPEVHVVWLGESTFVIAHTEEERATIPLEQCTLHQWLLDIDNAPHEPGYYRAYPHMADPDSESYGADPWDFEPLVTMTAAVGGTPD
jgi:hypothetical protein